MFNICSMFPKDFCEINKINKLKKEELPSVKELLNSKDSTENNIELIKSITKLKISNNIVEENVYHDLEIFKGNDSIENSIFNIINKTDTIFGNIFIKNIK